MSPYDVDIPKKSVLSLADYIKFPRIFVFAYVHCLGSVTAVCSIKHSPFPLFNTYRFNTIIHNETEEREMS